MRTLDLSAIAAKGYSFTEVLRGCAASKDVVYALDHNLFEIDAEFAEDSELIVFLDGTKMRLHYVETEYGYFSPVKIGDVVYLDIDAQLMLTPQAYQRGIKDPHFRRDFSYIEGSIDNFKLATVADIIQLSLTSADQRYIKEQMDAAARRGGRYSGLHAYVLAAKAKARKAEAQKEAKRKAKAKKEAQEEKAWKKQQAKERKAAIRRGDDRFRSAMMSYRLYANIDGFKVVPNAAENSLKIYERNDRYSNGCRFTKHVYSYELHIKKGWHFVSVGDLLTRYRGKFNRLGMPCTWIEQKGWDYTTARGYLVRGEHIIAKSLNEAIAINQEHRRALLQTALDRLHRQRDYRLQIGRTRQELERALAARKANAEAYMDNVITFEDSLASGNCRPGTQQFKDNVENALGKEVEQLTVRDIIPLAIRFHQETYVQRIFNHKGWKVEVNDYR